MRIYLLVSFILICVCVIESTLGPGDKRKKLKETLENEQKSDEDDSDVSSFFELAHGLGNDKRKPKTYGEQINQEDSGPVNADEPTYGLVNTKKNQKLNTKNDEIEDEDSDASNFLEMALSQGTKKKNQKPKIKDETKNFETSDTPTFFESAHGLGNNKKNQKPKIKNEETIDEDADTSSFLETAYGQGSKQKSQKPKINKDQENNDNSETTGIFESAYGLVNKKNKKPIYKNEEIKNEDLDTQNGFETTYGLDYKNKKPKIKFEPKNDETSDTPTLSESAYGLVNTKKNQKPKIKNEEIDNEISDSETPTHADGYDSSVFDRGLVVTELTVNDIIENHQIYCKSCSKVKTFKGTVLGYVTPWNSKGYTVSKLFSNKFDYISPAWFQIKKTYDQTYDLIGTLDINKSWMQEVIKSSNNHVSIVPRIIFDNWSPVDINQLFTNEEEQQALVNMLVNKAKKYNFGGFVLEIYKQLQGFINKSSINQLVKDLSSALHEDNKILVVVIPPDRDSTKFVFLKDDFDEIKDDADYFSLPIYDYTSSPSAGPTAPYDWIKDIVESITSSKEYRQKILIGLNFYGMKFFNKTPRRPAEAICGNTLVQLLSNNKYTFSIEYDTETKEHYFTGTSSDDSITIYFPTLYSIKKRLDLANKLGTGVSIWELGQGLDYFYDLL